MKTLYFTTFCFTLFLTSCNGNSSSSGLTFETIEVERHVGITQETDAPQCSVNLRLAAAKGEPQECTAAINTAIAEELFDIESSQLQQAADSFANKYTSDYQRNFAPLYREDKGDATKRAWYEYHYNINSEIAEGRDGVTVYKATVDYYEGGAHSINQIVLMNFDSATGRLLTLSDVFVPGFEQPLNDRLLTLLMERTGTKNTDELRAKGYLYAMDMFAPENFALNKDEITFVYNPYEIASYSEGIIELKTDYDQLEYLLKK